MPNAQAPRALSLPSPEEFPPAKTKDVEMCPLSNAQYPLWHLSGGQPHCITDKQFSLGISPAQDVEKGQCGFSTPSSPPPPLSALGAEPEKARPAQHTGGMQLLAAAAAALQSISARDASGGDQILSPHLLKVQLSSAEHTQRAQGLSRCSLQDQMENRDKCASQKCKQQQRGSRRLEKCTA